MRKATLLFLLVLVLPACGGGYGVEPRARIENHTTKTVVVFIANYDGTEARYGSLPPGEGLTFWGNCRAGLVARDSAGNSLERRACLKVWETWVIQPPPP